jgi:hypothetical protein
MTSAEFKRKWARYSGKETAAYQEHCNDLCALLGHPSPAAADPTGSESFCFQKRVMKDAELFGLEDSGRIAEEPEIERERGFADVWKKGCFAWEYKGKKKNLDAAYQQLLRYRESLLNPPLLVVCDFDRYIVRTNFNGTVQETHGFTNANIDTPAVLHLLRAVFTNPDFLKPQRTTAEVTEKLAAQIGEVARSLQERESIELADARMRREHSVAQRKNLRIARFLNRIVFCFFAQNTGLLPKNLVTEILKTGVDDPEHFSETLEELFSTMGSGGRFGAHKIRHFDGHLFEEATVFQLNEDEISALASAGEADWQFIQPSIMGTLFERALESAQRAQIGALHKRGRYSDLSRTGAHGAAALRMDRTQARSRQGIYARRRHSDRSREASRLSEEDCFRQSASAWLCFAARRLTACGKRGFDIQLVFKRQPQRSMETRSTAEPLQEKI